MDLSYSLNKYSMQSVWLPGDVYKNVDPEETAIWPWPRGYKIFLMLNPAEHEIFSANKYSSF